MPTPAKVAEVQEIKDLLSSSRATLLTEYRGLKVSDLKELRTALRSKAGAEYRVVKNTLAAIAAREAGMEGLAPMLEGPTALAFVSGDPVEAAKALAEFSKRLPALVIRGGVFEGKVIGVEEVRTLATLETREVLLAKLAGAALAALARAAGMFQAPLSQMARLAAALRDEAGKSAPAPQPSG
ncbi:MAG: 50S ribosomal protein L10 [Actinomycetota bacterium]